MCPEATTRQRPVAWKQSRCETGTTRIPLTEARTDKQLSRRGPAIPGQMGFNGVTAGRDLTGVALSDADGCLVGSVPTMPGCWRLRPYVVGDCLSLDKLVAAGEAALNRDFRHLRPA